MNEQPTRWVAETSASQQRDQQTQLLAQLSSLTEGESFAISHLSNAASLLWHTLPGLNWVGFYLRRGNELVLGPFMGRPACLRIPLGRGVCGTAAALDQVQRVPDVHAFPGHIACDSASNSEIVVPMRQNGQVIAVLDIDSPYLDRFSQEDEAFLTAFADKLCEACDFSQPLITLD
ncbi:MAG: GAF domain-containing protein [Acutalibacteraceae bacterium]